MKIEFGPRREIEYGDGKLNSRDKRTGKPVEVTWWRGDIFTHQRVGFLVHEYGPCPTRGENNYDGTHHSTFLPDPHGNSVRFYGLGVDKTESLNVYFEERRYTAVGLFEAVEKDIRRQIKAARR